MSINAFFGDYGKSGAIAIRRILPATRHQSQSDNAEDNSFRDVWRWVMCKKYIIKNQLEIACINREKRNVSARYLHLAFALVFTDITHTTRWF